jgi:hypothetical protein
VIIQVHASPAMVYIEILLMRAHVLMAIMTSYNLVSLIHITVCLVSIHDAAYAARHLLLFAINA